MTKLTLYWHLKTIIKGVPEVKSKPVSRDEYGVTDREYTDNFYETGSGKHSKKNGCVNDSYNEHIAFQALYSEDSVAYLDSVAHDPCVPYQWRVDASELLSHHIMERRVIPTGEKRSIFNDDNRSMRNDFIESDLPKRSMQSSRWTLISCKTCNEIECLFDVDQKEEPNHCLNCNTKIPIPKYP